MFSLFKSETAKNTIPAAWCLVMAVLLGPFTAIPVLFMLPSLAKIAKEKGLAQPELTHPYNPADSGI